MLKINAESQAITKPGDLQNDIDDIGREVIKKMTDNNPKIKTEAGQAFANPTCVGCDFEFGQFGEGVEEAAVLFVFVVMILLLLVMPSLHCTALPSSSRISSAAVPETS
jgi:hypothetical protein